ncbi:hypothetical protein CF319_g8627, partial [Tilletia indica]
VSFDPPWDRPYLYPMRQPVDVFKSLENYLERQCKRLKRRKKHLPSELKSAKFEERWCLSGAFPSSFNHQELGQSPQQIDSLARHLIDSDRGKVPGTQAESDSAFEDHRDPSMCVAANTGTASLLLSDAESDSFEIVNTIHHSPSTSTADEASDSFEFIKVNAASKPISVEVDQTLHQEASSGPLRKQQVSPSMPTAQRMFGSDTGSRRTRCLTEEIDAFYKRNLPSTDEHKMRQIILDRITEAIVKWISDASISSFGSSAKGTGAPTADIDANILLSLQALRSEPEPLLNLAMTSPYRSVRILVLEECVRAIDAMAEDRRELPLEYWALAQAVERLIEAMRIGKTTVQRDRRGSSKPPQRSKKRTVGRIPWRRMGHTAGSVGNGT